MHELSLIHSLLEIVEEHARQHACAKVNSLRLSFGMLSCLDRQALQFAFNVQAKGTRAENARLDFDILPAVVYCFACGVETRQGRFNAACPHCGSEQVTLTGGTEELRLLELDVD
jgi:hydrogenase nickel incorporation protein HypA/HybF